MPGLRAVVIFMNYKGQASSQLGVKRSITSDPRKQICMTNVLTFITHLCFEIRQFKITTKFACFNDTFNISSLSQLRILCCAMKVYGGVEVDINSLLIRK
jgi:hypothetical protein